MDKKNIDTFAYIRYLNQRYVEAIGTPDEEFWLKVCTEVFDKEILQAGLANEYAEHCRIMA